MDIFFTGHRYICSLTKKISRITDGDYFRDRQVLTLHELHPSVNIANLLGCYSNGFKFLIKVSYTILQHRLHTLLSEYQ